MAAQNKLFQRLIWLVDTIYSAGHISREEIDRRWATARYNDMHETTYGERNFHRHRETVQEIFGIDIVCNHTTTSTDKPFRLPKDFKPSLFFKGQYGVDRSIREEQKIVVKVESYDANFLRSLPLHASQIEMKQDDQYTYFSFYVAPTYDFIQELRKFGPSLEVLEPALLRDAFKKDSEKLMNLYA